MKVKINNTNISVHKEGLPFVCLFVLLGFISLSFYGLNFLTFILLFLGSFMLFFFREPERIVNKGENNILSPADGKIVSIEQASVESIFESEGLKNKLLIKISISIGALDSHIQKNPVSGKIIDIKYEEGKFLNTSLEKEHKDSEKNHILVQKNNQLFVVSQISGIIARRISCYLKINEDVQQGQDYGIIKFGSMVNLYIPLDSKLIIKKGQTVIAGETILATID